MLAAAGASNGWDNIDAVLDISLLCNFYDGFVFKTIGICIMLYVKRQSVPDRQIQMI